MSAQSPDEVVEDVPNVTTAVTRLADAVVTNQNYNDRSFETLEVLDFIFLTALLWEPVGCGWIAF